MMETIGIIADDLTGANDSGVQLTEKGINTSVLFDIPQQLDYLDSGLVIDTNSRSLSREEAFSVTRQASQFLKNKSYPHIYKKMDSTLRGHIGIELKALYEVFLPEFVFIAPAFPPYGRTTNDGVHYVKGEKITNTEISRDPKHPITESSIPRIIEKDIGQKVGLLHKADLNNSFTAWLQKMNDFRATGVNYVVCDAETQEDLKLAAQRMAHVTNNIVWAGSAGLAEVLPEVLGIDQRKEQRPFATSPQVMTVCGSLSKVTQQQVQYAMEHPDMLKVEVDTAQIFSEDWSMISLGYINECLDGLKLGNDLVLYVPSDQQTREQIVRIAEEQHLSGSQVGERISAEIGKIVAEVAELYQELLGLVLTGGDTAKDTSRYLGGIGFRLIRQIEAGIPLGSLIGTKREITAVTKAGAFGEKGSIYRAMQELKGVQNDEQ